MISSRYILFSSSGTFRPLSGKDFRFSTELKIESIHSIAAFGLSREMKSDISVNRSSESGDHAVLGHSKVKRLARNAGPTGWFPNLKLNPDEVQINFIGIGGANRHTMHKQLPEVASLSPDIVILEVGSNDLCDSSLHPTTLAKSLVNLARKLNWGNHARSNPSKGDT